MSVDKLFEDAQKLLDEYSHVGISSFFKPVSIYGFCKYSVTNKACFGSAREIVCRFEVEDIYLNANGYFHGGLAAVVVDAVTFIAASTLVDDFHGASVGMSVRYLKGLKKGEEVHLKAEAARAGKKFFICKADFIDKDGKLAIRGDQTIYRRPKSSGSMQKTATDLQPSAKL